MEDLYAEALGVTPGEAGGAEAPLVAEVGRSQGGGAGRGARGLC